MPSLAVDVLLCVILVGSAYILFARSPTTSTTASKKKKKRTKPSKKVQQTNPSSSEAPQAVSISNEIARPAPVKPDTSNDLGRSTPAAKSKAASRDQAPLDGSNRVSQQEDFPPLLSASRGNAAAQAKANDRKPLAERVKRTQPKTAADDMVEGDDPLQGQKTYSRTMRIIKPTNDQPLLLDESLETEDDNTQDWEPSSARPSREPAWESVPERKSSTLRIPSSSSSQAPSSQSASRSVPGLTELTKKQRQNARKAAELKAAREQAEHDRLQRLAAHKRALEREKMNEQIKPRGKQSGPHVQKTRREDLSGGMSAAVHDGKLIWE